MSLLIVGGLYDAEDPYGVWEAYRSLKENNPSLDCRIVVGPWTHGAWRGNGDANALGGVEFAALAVLPRRYRVSLLRAAPARRGVINACLSYDILYG